MQISFAALEFGKSYDRPYLAELWGYQSHKAIERGVVTPAGTNYIILFVTKVKQETLTQYNDYLDGDILFWEGEKQHGSDQRIINANRNKDEIHLFYRDIHHTPFIYFGKIKLTDFQLRTKEPSEFVFAIGTLPLEIDTFKEVREHAPEYRTLEKTEQEQIRKSRIGQGIFRQNVIRLWGSCSITGLQNVTLLRASHIKPWRDSTNKERLSPFNGLLLVPNYDVLFDKGYLTFRDNGEIVVSKRLGPVVREVFDVNEDLKLRRIFKENKEYLEFHRSEVFEKFVVTFSE
jgi:HNH endonuclease